MIKVYFLAKISNKAHEYFCVYLHEIWCFVDKKFKKSGKKKIKNRARTDNTRKTDLKEGSRNLFEHELVEKESFDSRHQS